MDDYFKTWLIADISKYHNCYSETSGLDWKAWQLCPCLYKLNRFDNVRDLAGNAKRNVKETWPKNPEGMTTNIALNNRYKFSLHDCIIPGVFKVHLCKWGTILRENRTLDKASVLKC